MIINSHRVIRGALNLAGYLKSERLDTRNEYMQIRNTITLIIKEDVVS